MHRIQSKHILIVEDSPDQQFLLKMFLEANGYTADCTSNGEEALSLLRSNAKRPITILLDLNMPVMGGFDFRRLQRQDPLIKDIPVIVMSAEDNVALTHQKTDADVIKKPVNIANLLEVIKKTRKDIKKL